jgi:DNA polymerase-1
MIYGFDCETHLIKPGSLAPPMVCYTESAEGEVGGRLFHALYNCTEIIERIVEITDGDNVIVGANTAYDVAVLIAWEPELAPLFFNAYHEGRVEDVQLNQKLIDLSYGRLAQSGYSLADLVLRRLQKDRFAEKRDPDAWRMRYAELENVRPEDWPEGARVYAVDDAIDARDVLLSQRAEAGRYQHQAAEQARASLALHLLCVEGVYTDAATIEALKELTVQRFHDLTQSLIGHGLVRAKGSRDTKKAKERLINAYLDAGIPIPLTDTGITIGKARAEAHGLQDVKPIDLLSGEEIEKYASLDKVACEESGDPVLKEYARFTSLKGIVDTHIPDLEKGVWPGTPIQAYFNALLESGRVSCSKGRGGSTNGFQLTNPARGLEVLCPACAGHGCKACKDRGEVPSEVDIRSCFMATSPGSSCPRSRRRARSSSAIRASARR